MAQAEIPLPPGAKLIASPWKPGGAQAETPEKQAAAARAKSFGKATSEQGWSDLRHNIGAGAIKSAARHINAGGDLLRRMGVPDLWEPTPPTSTEYSNRQQQYAGNIESLLEYALGSMGAARVSAALAAKYGLTGMLTGMGTQGTAAALVEGLQSGGDPASMASTGVTAAMAVPLAHGISTALQHIPGVQALHRLIERYSPAAESAETATSVAPKVAPVAEPVATPVAAPVPPATTQTITKVAPKVAPVAESVATPVAAPVPQATTQTITNPMKAIGKTRAPVAPPSQLEMSMREAQTPPLSQAVRGSDGKFMSVPATKAQARTVAAEPVPKPSTATKAQARTVAVKPVPKPSRKP